MSVQAMTAVLEHSEARYGTRLVLIAIANHANERGEHSFPNLETIGHEAGLSVRQVIRAVQIAEGMGELEVQRESNKPNRYVLTFDSLRSDNLSPAKGSDTSKPNNPYKSLSTYGSGDISGPHMSRDKMSPQSPNAQSEAYCGICDSEDCRCLEPSWQAVVEA